MSAPILGDAAQKALKALKSDILSLAATLAPTSHSWATSPFQTLAASWFTRDHDVEGKYEDGYLPDTGFGWTPCVRRGDWPDVSRDISKTFGEFADQDVSSGVVVGGSKGIRMVFVLLRSIYKKKLDRSHLRAFLLLIESLCFVVQKKM
ncbi:hypothetical protein RQP46_006199 [Phenoliferia psychrophenolica]